MAWLFLRAREERCLLFMLLAKFERTSQQHRWLPTFGSACLEPRTLPNSDLNNVEEGEDIKIVEPDISL